MSSKRESILLTRNSQNDDQNTRRLPPEPILSFLRPTSERESLPTEVAAKKQLI